MPTRRPLPVLRPERLRCVPRSFAWLDHRLRSCGLLASLLPEELGLYLFLVLAADAKGLSCWRLDRIEREIPFSVGDLRKARDGLARKNLVAFQPWRPDCLDGSYQLLSLPLGPSPPGPGLGPGSASVGQLLTQFTKSHSSSP